MPMYCYECDKCGYAAEDFQTMRDAAHTICPVCSETAYHRVPTLPQTDMREFQEPIEMYSIALNTPEEVRQFQAQCPDVKISDDETDPMFGIPVAATRKQKLAALRAAGFTEKR